MDKPTIYENGIVNVDIGENVKIVSPVNLYGCKLSDDSFVGPFVEIQKNASIGKRTRIHSHSFVCELVEIGDDCFIAHGVMFINDLLDTGKPSPNMETWKSTKIGSCVSIGSNATILPVTICDHVVVGAGAVVTKDITKPGFYVGNPARFLKPIAGLEDRANAA